MFKRSPSAIQSLVSITALGTVESKNRRLERLYNEYIEEAIFLSQLLVLCLVFFHHLWSHSGIPYPL